MPLNRLNPRNPPAPNEDDAEPLIDKLKYDPKFEKAFQQVFGKTCVCKDLTIAASYVRSHGINTITLDGDKVDRKGALTGGYHDVRRSRIEGIKNVATWRSKYDADKKRSDEVKQSISRLEQEITGLAGKITILNGQQGQIRESRDRMTDDGITVSREKERVKARIVKLEMDIDELEMEQHSLQTKIAGYNQELASPLSNGLTGEEEGLIATLGKEVERRKKETLELSKRRNQVCYSSLEPNFSGLLIFFWQVESQKNAIEIELKESLRRREEDIQTKLEGLGDPDDDGTTTADDLESRTRELRALCTSIESLARRVKGEHELLSALPFIDDEL